jgi:two-component system, NarL family, invasion response regulator UvrY
MRKIRIFIADDHPIVRQGLRQIVATAGDMVITGEAATGLQLLEQARLVEHDVVLLDLSMPGMSGLDVVKQYKREHPKTPVVILTMYSEDQYAVRSLRAGASAYLMKDSAPTELVAAIRKVVSGGRYLTTSVAEKIAGHLANGDSDTPLHTTLSDREYQVFRMIAAGRPTRTIAQELSLSVKTIGTYRARIYEKMRMKSPAELAAYVVRNRLSE